MGSRLSGEEHKSQEGRHATWGKRKAPATAGICSQRRGLYGVVRKRRRSWRVLSTQLPARRCRFLTHLPLRIQVYGNTLKDCDYAGIKIEEEDQGVICENDITLPPGVSSSKVGMRAVSVLLSVSLLRHVTSVVSSLGWSHLLVDTLFSRQVLKPWC